MLLKTLGRPVSSRLGAKSILAVVLLISVISATLTTVFISRQRESMLEELRKRALSLSGNLAYNSQLAALSLDALTMQELISGVLKESEIVQALITDLDGQVLADADTERIGHTLLSPEELDTLQGRRWYPTQDPEVWRAVAMIEISLRATDTNEMLLFSHPRPLSHVEAGPSIRLQKLGFAVLDVSLARVNASLRADTRLAVLITLVMVALGALAAILLVRHVAGPISQLAEATRAVAQGDLKRKAPISREDEIGQLADSFNNMIDQLNASRGKIEAWNRELEASVLERTRELEEKHNELERAYEALKTLDKAKDDFLSLVSHELRTPLSSILLYSEMLLDGLADSEHTRTEFLSTIVDNCKRLTRLINDVLDLSKIEAGRMRFKLDKLVFPDVLAETLNSLRPSIEAASIRFDYHDKAKDLRLWGDQDKVIQVLTNIISNAVRFTPENGAITVTLERAEHMGLVSVADTGKGIAPEDIPKVFDRFGQLESIEHHSHGSGLGMTISKSIIERLGGEIWIESAPGAGATVFFTLLDADLRGPDDLEEEEENELNHEYQADQNPHS